MGPRTAAAKPTTKPTYAVMITESVAELKERSGSSLAAITKSITANHGTVNRPALNAALKKMVEAGTLTKIKASYKLTKPATKKKPVKKVVPAKAAAKPKKTIMKKRAPAKSTTTRKATTKKAVTKKTPVAKKSSTKKATTKTRTTTTKRTKSTK